MAPGNIQAWHLPSPRGQLRIEKNGGNCLWNHVWCPNNPRGGIDDDYKALSFRICWSFLGWDWASWIVSTSQIWAGLAPFSSLPGSHWSTGISGLGFVFLTPAFHKAVGWHVVFVWWLALSYVAGPWGALLQCTLSQLCPGPQGLWSCLGQVSKDCLVHFSRTCLNIINMSTMLQPWSENTLHFR